MSNAGRTTVMTPKAMMATSHPLAVQAGLDVMREGGNAIDACISATAVLDVVEPMSTGIGGDLFALVWHAESKQLYALNASGAYPKNIDLDYFKGMSEMPAQGIHAVSVPGTTRGWETLLKRFGSKPLSRLLEPAIGYASEGFPVSEIVARRWAQYTEWLSDHDASKKTFLPEGRAPRAGEIFRNSDLAKSLTSLANEGADALYEGEISEQIVSESRKLGGHLQAEDLKSFQPSWVEPISAAFRDVTVYEQPPNDQGLIALLALNIAEGFDLSGMEHNSAEYLHVLIEATKLAFADGLKYIADPQFAEIPIEALLSDDYSASRRSLIGDRAISSTSHGLPEGGTVYISAADPQGNVVSFIESVFMPFGSGVTVPGTGMILQNRAALFSLDPNHSNSIQPGKRPLHTIIPAMAFRNDKPWLSFGMVGGFMQPQGHLQLLSSLIEHGLSPQEAIEAPRFRYFDGNRVALETGISDQTRKKLVDKGHDIFDGDNYFGGAQMIMIDPESGVLHGGSDPRKDGCVQGF
jgi:gamma-glutamyltranspeptidase/glutathione hydrolase